MELTTSGKFVKQLSVDPAQGASFGLAVTSGRGGTRFAYVDDAANTLTIFNLPLP